MPSGAVTVQALAMAVFRYVQGALIVAAQSACCPLVMTSPLVAMLARTMAEPMPAMSSPRNGPATSRMIAVISFPT